MALLLEPVNTEDPNARRADQVDDLYSFPDSLVAIAPRLRRYMEMIFVQGEWSPKPLFVRGIYFTSSMRQGSALDKELADALGVPVDSLPEGRVWDQERAFFLRDLFMKKVFPEKGLVTREKKATGLHRRRKVAVLAAGFGAVRRAAGADVLRLAATGEEHPLPPRLVGPAPRPLGVAGGSWDLVQPVSDACPAVPAVPHRGGRAQYKYAGAVQPFKDTAAVQGRPDDPERAARRRHGRGAGPDRGAGRVPADGLVPGQPGREGAARGLPGGVPEDGPGPGGGRRARTG